MRYLACALALAVGCARAPSPPADPAAALPDVPAAPSPPPTSPTPRPAPPADVPLTAAMLEPLFAPRLGAARARQVADLLDGASLIDVALTADGQGSATLVHRQRRSLYVAGAGPMFHVGLSAAEARGRQADRLTGVPAEVSTPEGLASWLDGRPQALETLRAGPLALPALLGFYRLEPRPARLGCTAVTTTAGVTRLTLTADFLGLPVTFRAAHVDGRVAVQRLDKIGEEDWVDYLGQHLTRRERP